nr:ESPR-type extended signal peptide-containing protein [Pasteurella multocida]
MNKIYRTLWNAATQSWVVVSELVKAGGKSASGKSALVNSVSGFSFTLIAASVVLAAGTASAADVLGNTYPLNPNTKGNYCFFDVDSKSVICGDENTKTEDKADNKPAKSVVMGFGATNKGESNVAIGAKSQSSKAASIAIGDNAKALDNQTIAIGQNATANSDWDISIGRQAGADQTEVSAEGRNIAIGDGALKRGKGVNNNIALGTSAGGQLAGTHNVLMGTYVNTDEAVRSALSAGSTTKEINAKETTDNKYYIEASNTVALGTRALATQTAAVAIGQQAKAFGVTTVAVGNGSRALNNNAVAMGREANAGASGAIAIGLRANYDSKNQNKAEGYKTTGANSVAIGVETHAQGTHSVAMGSYATIKALLPTDFTAGKITDKKGNVIDKASLGSTLTGNGSVAIGSESLVRGTNSVAIGQAAETLGQNAFAGGNDSHANGKSAVAIGDGATALKDSSTAIGSYTKALEGGAGAFAYHAQALAFRSLALGAESLAQKVSSIAIGDSAKADASGAIVLGTKAEASSLTGADGKKYGAYSAIVIGTEAKAIAQQIQNGKYENPKDAIAIGTKAEAHYASAIALGAGAKSNAKAQAVSIGYNSNAKGYQAIAFGSEAKTDETAGSSIAFGTKAYTRSAGSLAFGAEAETGFEGGSATDGAGAVALGWKAKAKKQSSMALGQDAVSDHKNAVALGAGAETAEAVGTNEATVNEFKYSGFAGIKPIATVSVGKAGSERTITNVAAGRINATSTDAINGSQLYLALNTLGNVGNTLVTNVLGGNAAITKDGNEAGTLTMTDIGGTGENTIHAAIQAVNNTAKASKTTVKEGDNITVTEEAAADGSRTYTVATKKDVKFDSVVAGGTKIDANGLTFVDDQGTKIDNTPSISKTGIDAGNQKVTNVQNGTVEKDSKDAVNGGQLFAQGEGVKNIIGGDTTYDPTTGTYANTNIGGYRCLNN